MKYFFDNNLSLHLAHAVAELCKVEDSVEAVIHLRDKFAPNAKDHDWITALASEGHWAVVSQDGLRKNDLERKALRESGLIVFVLHRQWAERRHWDKAHNLVKWCPLSWNKAGASEAARHFAYPGDMEPGNLSKSDYNVGEANQYRMFGSLVAPDRRMHCQSGSRCHSLNPNAGDGNTRHHRNTRRQAPRCSRSAARRHRQSIKGFSSWRSPARVRYGTQHSERPQHRL